MQVGETAVNDRGGPTDLSRAWRRSHSSHSIISTLGYPRCLLLPLAPHADTRHEARSVSASIHHPGRHMLKIEDPEAQIAGAYLIDTVLRTDLLRW